MTMLATLMAVFASTVAQTGDAVQPVNYQCAPAACAMPAACAVPANCALPTTCAVPAGCGMPVTCGGLSDACVYGDPCNLQCFNGYDNGWCHSCHGDCGYGCGCGCGDGGHGCCLCGIRLMSTCGLIPHYAYQPAYHGYYYFRPYNYSSIEQQKQLSVAMGGDARAPYATPMFKPVYESFAMTGYEERGLDVPKVPAKVGAAPLPMLESLLTPAE